ncbi:MAG: lipopolysaccharide biosynthesis protein [Coriobacteriia bacterium]|nr:lipopolysaccharide biosynthesis protein [Coriobacteriia bacterium]
MQSADSGIAKSGLRDKSAKAAAWSALGLVLSQPVAFLTTVVLARLLRPSDFGVMAMIGTVFGLATILNDFGLSSALIRRQHLSDEEIHSAFWLNIFVGVVVSGLGLAAAGLVAAFYRAPEARPVMMAMSAMFLVASIELVPRVLLTRQYRFRAIATAGVVAAIVDALVSIPAALIGWGVWAIVAGTLAAALASAITMFVSAGWRPRLHFAWREAVSFATYGGVLTLAGVANFFSANVDNVLVGRLLGATSLGHYAVAFNLMSIPARRLPAVVSKAALPGFAALQDDVQRLRRAYLDVVSYSALIAGPILAVAAVLARPLIEVIYGPQWSAAVQPFTVLCAAGYAIAVTTLAGLVFKAFARADLELWWSLAMLVAIGAGAALGARWGVLGIAVGVTVSTVIVRGAMQAHTTRLLGLTGPAFASSIVPSLMTAAIAAAVAVGLRLALEAVGAPSLILLPCASAGGLGLAWLVMRNSPMRAPLRELETLGMRVLRSLPSRTSHASPPEEAGER